MYLYVLANFPIEQVFGVVPEILFKVTADPATLPQTASTGYFTLHTIEASADDPHVAHQVESSKVRFVESAFLNAVISDFVYT